jgi:hypothetical protein
MRLEDASGASSRVGIAKVETQAQAGRDRRDHRPTAPARSPEHEPQTTGAIAMALARAKLKK